MKAIPVSPWGCGISLLLLLSIIGFCWTFRVSYELDDRFTEYRKDAKWLVMFYAPWCHHCQKAEPVWEQVAQTFNQQQAGLGLRVGKIDATKQTKSAGEFKIKGFPTIKYISGDRTVTYDGERTREDIEDFAMKVIGPAVRKISSLGDLHAVEKKGEVFFILIVEKGATDGAETGLAADYAQTADQLMASTYFYQTDSLIASGNIPVKNVPAVAVYKNGHYALFKEGEDLKKWVMVERLPTFSRISGGNFYQFMELHKPLVMAVVEVPISSKKQMPPVQQQVLDSVRTVALHDGQKYHQHFSFGFLDGNEIVNQVVSQWITVPALVVYDSQSEVYHVYSEPIEEITEEAIQSFLDSIQTGELKGFGGKGWFRKAYKFCYSVCAYFYKMFSTQPILASILFGLPLGILSIIVVMTYTNDCTDVNKDEDDSDHEKEE
ncbi:protein disulfide-isomerase TMX3-like isoform X2 [Paramacrobiotus metropolitanus]|uniref:protein disulfide-isomerase TMX3-like isoform X2 n=1 Tax=Paramacrobiotus metropolitanus TaxID=2943436 RepID=UPI002445CD95|nr:protein disulfide-isomerase TMX3-like isoform X2 [Paramacrobiotus metropolitanus]